MKAEGQVSTLEFYDGPVEDSLKRSHLNSKCTGGNVHQIAHNSVHKFKFLPKTTWVGKRRDKWLGRGLWFWGNGFCVFTLGRLVYIYKPRANDSHRKCEGGDLLGEKPRFLASETRLESSFSAEMERLSFCRCQLQLPRSRAALSRLGPSHTSPGVLLKCRFCLSRYGLSARASPFPQQCWCCWVKGWQVCGCPFFDGGVPCKLSLWGACWWMKSCDFFCGTL